MFEAIKSLLSVSSTSDCAPAPVTPGMTPIESFDSSNSNFPLPPSNSSNPFNLDPSTAHEIISDPAAAQHHLHGSTEQNYSKEVGFGGPGAFDKSDSEAVRILKPEIFDGCRFEHNKQLGQNFSVSHSLWLGSMMLPTGNNYQFGSTVILNNGKTMLQGRMSEEGRLDAQFHHEILQPQRIVARVVSSIDSEQNYANSVTHSSLEFNGKDFNGSMKIAKGPIVALSYFQTVVDKIALGAEGFFHGGQGISHVFGRAKYDDKKNIVNATISTMDAASVNYVRKVSDRLSLACELEAQRGYGGEIKTNMNFGYEYLLRQSKINGVISTDGVVQSQITEAIAPGFHLVFNAILDHKKDSHRFGYGVQIG